LSKDCIKTIEIGDRDRVAQQNESFYYKSNTSMKNPQLEYKVR
jgi:hypothetical protein